MKENPTTLFEFTERLQEEVKKSGLSIPEFARLSNTPRHSVYNILQGYYTINISTLARFCKVLNVSADYLLFGGK